MIYLLFSILCSTAIALLLKSSEHHRRDRLTVTTANYVVASLVSLTVFLLESPGDRLMGEPAALLPFRLWAPGPPPSDLHGLVWAIVIGILGGIAYFAGFITIQRSIRVSGVALTGAVSKLAILIPMVLSMVLWQELPGMVQAAGIVLALAAIVLAHLSGKDLGRLGALNLVMIWMFLSVGMGEFANKLFQQYGFSHQKGLFLLAVFCTALMISGAALLRQRKKPRTGDLCMGFLVGIPNMLTSLFLIKSFATVPAPVAFPVYGAGTIVMVAMGGWLLFGEELRKRQWAAIAIAVLSVILMQIR